VDYRKLNDITQSDGYPIPRIDEIIQKLGDSNYLSRVDLSKGFWQCELHEQSRAKSAFITPFGQYEFNGRTVKLASRKRSNTFLK
jgi:hypothetical protein